MRSTAAHDEENRPSKDSFTTTTTTMERGEEEEEEEEVKAAASDRSIRRDERTQRPDHIFVGRRQGVREGGKEDKGYMCKYDK
jgi:hypothetical protein